MLHDTDEENFFLTTDISSELKTRVISRIDQFHILCIYDSREKAHHFNYYAKEIIRGKKDGVSLFSNEREGETFIISETSYQQNQELFRKLRTAAREDVFTRIATSLTAYFLTKYASSIQSVTSQHPELKSRQVLDKSVQKIKLFLKKNTFLSEEAAWDTFCDWFKSGLTRFVVREMVQKHGTNKLEHMEQRDLNELFQHQLTVQIHMNSALMMDFIEKVEQYLQRWMNKIIPVLDENPLYKNQIESFLGLKSEASPSKAKNSALPLDVTDGHLSVMSNQVYQSIREALSRRFYQQDDSGPWPAAPIDKGTVNGMVSIQPYGSEAEPSEASVFASWRQAESMTELDVDVLDALCSFFLSSAAYHQDVVEIKIQDLLAIRGLKPKRSGNKRRGGYEPKQVQQILKALSNIQDLWVELDKVVIYEKGKPVDVTLRGRPFLFLNSQHQICDVRERDTDDRLLFTVGELFTKFLRGSSRQIALLPLKTLQYNPRQEQWEKQLIRYLSWRWRTQARKANYMQPYKIGGLLNAINRTINFRTPSRTRERLEQALDRLQDDGLIGSWEYLEWDEEIVATKGWARIWENIKVVIEPPVAIKEKYHTITRKGGSRQGNRQKSDKSFPLGNQLKEFRQRLGLTIKQTAEELEMSTAYVSNIEKGKRIPSEKLSQRIWNWIQ